MGGFLEEEESEQALTVWQKIREEIDQLELFKWNMWLYRVFGNFRQEEFRTRYPRYYPLVYLPDGKRFVTRSGEDEIGLVDLETRSWKTAKIPEMGLHNGVADCMEISPDGHSLIVKCSYMLSGGRQSYSLVEFDLLNIEEGKEIELDQNLAFSQFCFLDDSRLLLVAPTEDQKIGLFIYDGSGQPFFHRYVPYTTLMPDRVVAKNLDEILLIKGSSSFFMPTEKRQVRPVDSSTIRPYQGNYLAMTRAGIELYNEETWQYAGIDPEPDLLVPNKKDGKERYYITNFAVDEKSNVVVFVDQISNSLILFDLTLKVEFKRIGLEEQNGSVDFLDIEEGRQITVGYANGQIRVFASREENEL